MSAPKDLCDTCSHKPLCDKHFKATLGLGLQTEAHVFCCGVTEFNWRTWKEGEKQFHRFYVKKCESYQQSDVEGTNEMKEKLAKKRRKR